MAITTKKYSFLDIDRDLMAKKVILSEEHYEELLAEIDYLKGETLKKSFTLDPADICITATCSGSASSIGGSPVSYSEPVSPFTESAIQAIKEEAHILGREAAYREITESPEMLVLTGITHGLSLEKIGKEVLRRGRLSNANTKPVS